MENYKYSLSKKGKNVCPECGRRTYVLYIDNTTGDPLHSTVGKCDRADNCGHHYTPKQYLSDNNISFDTEKGGRLKIQPSPTHRPKPEVHPSYIDANVFKKSLQGYENNRLIQYLCRIVGDEATKEAIRRYFIGTSKYWGGATVFWQVDGCGRIHAGKIMQYDNRTGKRVKEPVNKISWVHTVLRLADFQLSQCLFGEHLLNGNNKTVAIVESEKTAIIASCYLPKFIWLACGGCGNLSVKLCEPLKGRKVALFPDAGKYNEWREKAKALSTICTVSVFPLIENEASEAERKAGFDLADYLVRFSPTEFHEQTQLAEAPLKVTPAETPLAPERDAQYPAYVSDTGTLYIPTPPDGRITYTVYPSVEAYNKRSALPTIIPMQGVDISGMKQGFIDLKTLTI
ncbi:MAG: toprim domain-containing protein [Dysgonamonadaceae bacterium]|jgi:hypothetical protein|nr:toprim domain-containing protein [Dysgonamonadaceae bacterium]